jgi:hypothetical protein
MIDEELLNYMKEYKDLMEQTLNRVDALEDVLYKQILEPAKALNDGFEKDKRKAAFMEKHGSALSEFNDRLKAIEGEDFDLAEHTFEDYDNSDHSIGEDEYVAALVAKVKEQLDRISKVFGSPVTVEQKPDGDIEIKADDNGNGEGEETVAETETLGTPEADGETDREEEKAEEEAEKSEEEATEEEVIDSDEEIEALKKELEAELHKER